jgi:hypothetical protein
MHRRGAERRQFVRVADEVVVSVVRTGTPARDGHTLNFSAGGVLLVFDEYVEPGTTLRVCLRVGDDGNVLSFDGLVVRVRTLSDRTHEIAAEFVGGSAADQRRLQELIGDRLAPPPVGPPLIA